MPFKNHFNLNKKPKREEAKGGRIEEGETLYTEVTGHCRIARLRLLCKGCRRWLCCVVWVYKRVRFTWGGFLFLNWMADLTDANSATPLLPSLITFSLGYASSLQIQFWILVKKYYKKSFFLLMIDVCYEHELFLKWRIRLVRDWIFTTFNYQSEPGGAR